VLKDLADDIGREADTATAPGRPLQRHQPTVTTQSRPGTRSAGGGDLSPTGGSVALAPPLHHPPRHRAAKDGRDALRRHRYMSLRRPQDQPARRSRYLAVRTKFLIASGVGVVWMLFAMWLSVPWLQGFATVVGDVPAGIAIGGVSWVPGWLTAFLAASLVLDRQPRLRVAQPTDAVTVVIAARNESAGIGDTLERVANQDYLGPITLILADNGSTDGTADVAREAAQRLNLALQVITENRPGKSLALNTALATVRDEFVITLDADTLLHRTAVRHIVARVRSAPPDVVAVAGAVLVRNSRCGMWARMQEWDYFLGIASIKRMQGLYQCTLVAQGAFSLYRTRQVRDVGGWPDAIGEDIVVTWKLMEDGGRVFFEPLAVAFTDAPTRFVHFARQRARWARGMIEGLRSVPPWRQPRPMTRALISVNLLVPILDLFYTFIWLPGLVLAMFGHFWIVGPCTLLVLPVTMVINGILYRFQRNQVFDYLGLRVRRNWSGFLLYVVAYQIVMSPVAVVGYAQELLGLRRRWK
jgi:biofilm PGA synthesis N-glycosyltransferase PgaC